MNKEEAFYGWLVGRRVIITWTDKAHARGADWIAFRLIDAGPNSVWLEGVDSPDGAKHDGSKVSARATDIREITEWKEEP
jgi:hypothetical protein